MMELAFYRAPGTWADKAIRFFTGSPYSHCEIVISGTSCSSSIRDGGVRVKHIYLDPDKWDVVTIPGDEGAVWDWFATHAGDKYDYAGVFRFVIPFLPQRSKQWFCSEACAAALGLLSPSDWTPGDLAEVFLK